MRRRTAGFRRPILLISVVLLFGSAVACSGNDDRLVELRVGEHTFSVAIADEPEERQRGLMFRRDIGADEGMLFVFPDVAPRSFWMKDTPTPLSIAYIAPSGEILEIYDMEPLSRTPVRSRYAAKYALEVNQGRFEELGIESGTMIDVEALPRWVNPQ